MKSATLMKMMILMNLNTMFTSQDLTAESHKIYTPRHHFKESSRISIPWHYSDESHKIFTPRHHSKESSRIFTPWHHSDESHKIFTSRHLKELSRIFTLWHHSDESHKIFTSWDQTQCWCDHEGSDGSQIPAASCRTCALCPWICVWFPPALAPSLLSPTHLLSAFCSDDWL